MITQQNTGWAFLQNITKEVKKWKIERRRGYNVRNKWTSIQRLRYANKSTCIPPQRLMRFYTNVEQQVIDLFKGTAVQGGGLGIIQYFLQ